MSVVSGEYPPFINNKNKFRGYFEKKSYFRKKYLTLQRKSMYIALGLIMRQGF